MPAYTWTTGETITAAKLNALETEAWKIGNQIASNTSTASSSTTSAAWVDGAVSVTFTTVGTSVYVEVSAGNCRFNNSNTGILVGFQLNGTDYAVCGGYNATSIGLQCTMSGGMVVTGLTANTSYTAKIRFARTGTTANTVNLNFTTNSTTRQTITVFEVTK